MKIAKIFSVVLLGGALVATSVSADHHEGEGGIHFGGYVDAAWSSVVRDYDDALSLNSSDTNTFHVSEAALYVGKKFDLVEVYMDLALNGDFTNNSHFLSQNESQLWVAGSHENGMSWKFGRFDGLLGYYAGRMDSNAYNLSNMGYLQQFFPRTHTGLALGYNFSDMLDVQFFAVNASGINSTNGAATSNAGLTTDDGEGRHDYGLTVGADVDTFSVDLGFMLTTSHNAAASASPERDGMGYVGSLSVGTTFDPVSVGLYGMFRKPDDVEDADSDFGIGLDAGFEINEDIAMGLRAEWASIGDKNPMPGVDTNFDGITGDSKSVLAITAGPQYHFNDHVFAKFDYTFAQVKAEAANGGTDDADESTHHINLNVVAHF